MANCQPDPEIPRVPCPAAPAPEDIKLIPLGMVDHQLRNLLNNDLELIRCIIDHLGAGGGGAAGAGPKTVTDNGDGTVTVLDQTSGNSFVLDINEALDFTSITAAQITELSQIFDFSQLTPAQTAAFCTVVNSCTLVANALSDDDGDTRVDIVEAANDTMEFYVDNVNVMSLTNNKLTLNGIFIDPATGLELEQQAAVPVLATVPANTLWINSADGHLYRGSVDVEAAGGGANLAVANATGTTLDVVSDTGTNATLPAATATEAGVQSAADKVKSDFITATQAVNLDDLEQDVSDLTTLTGVASNATDLGTFTGTTVTDNSDVKTAIQELEVAVEGNTGTTNLSVGTVTATTVPISSDTGTDVNLPLATGTLAGLQDPSDKAKADLITVTQAVDLDAIEQDVSEHQTTLGVPDGSTDMGTYTGTLLTDNQTVKQNLQELETAISGLAGDGNDTPIVRGDAVTGVEPTVGEVATPEDGDTASVFLTDGQLEKWVHDGTAWSLAYTLAANEAANLGYTASPTGGTVTSSSGTDATLTLATTTNAGLQSPTDKTKQDFISVNQAVDLDELEAESANLVTLSGVASDATDLGAFSGSTISDNVNNKVALQELETELETKASLTELASNTNGEGASLLGIEDAAGNITATTVEGALSELAIASHADDDVETVTGTAVDNTDARNPVIDLQTASEVALTTAVNGQTTVQAALEDHETRLDAIEDGIDGGLIGTDR